MSELLIRYDQAEASRRSARRDRVVMLPQIGDVWVIAQCIGCSATREIRGRALRQEEVTCHVCGMPMHAVHATARRA
jgi:ribosomal protein S27E